MAALAFKDLAVGDRFQFRHAYGEGYDWLWNVKTGNYTYRTRRWRDGSGGEEGRVGVGDQLVVRLIGNRSDIEVEA